MKSLCLCIKIKRLRREKTGRVKEKRDPSTGSGTGEVRKIEDYNKNHPTNWCLRLSKAPLKKRENGKIENRKGNFILIPLIFLMLKINFFCVLVKIVFLTSYYFNPKRRENGKIEKREKIKGNFNKWRNWNSDYCYLFVSKIVRNLDRVFRQIYFEHNTVPKDLSSLLGIDCLY